MSIQKEVEKILNTFYLPEGCDTKERIAKALTQYMERKMVEARIDELIYCLEQNEDDMGKYPIPRCWVENERIKELKKRLK